jgi:hypothetical protein
MHLHVRNDYQQGSFSIVPPSKDDSEDEDGDRRREHVTARGFKGNVFHMDRNNESRMFRRWM